MSCGIWLVLRESHSGKCKNCPGYFGFQDRLHPIPWWCGICLSSLLRTCSQWFRTRQLHTTLRERLPGPGYALDLKIFVTMTVGSAGIDPFESFGFVISEDGNEHSVCNVYSLVWGRPFSRFVPQEVLLFCSDHELCTKHQQSPNVNITRPEPWMAA